MAATKEMLEKVLTEITMTAEAPQVVQPSVTMTVFGSVVGTMSAGYTLSIRPFGRTPMDYQVASVDATVDFDFVDELVEGALVSVTGRVIDVDEGEIAGSEHSITLEATSIKVYGLVELSEVVLDNE